MDYQLLTYEHDSELSYEYPESLSDQKDFNLNQFYPEIENTEQTSTQFKTLTMGEQLWSWQSYLDHKCKYSFKALLISCNQQKTFKRKKQCKKTEVEFQLSIINKECLIGQFYFNFKTRMIGYFINTILYQNEGLDIIDFDEISIKFFLQDLTNFQKYFNNLISYQEFQLLQQVEYLTVQANEIRPFIKCYQINTIIIYENAPKPITFALKNFEGNIIQSNLYVQQLDDLEMQNLKVLHYNFSFPNSQNLYSSIKYLQTYFISEKNQVYCLYPKFQTLKQYLKTRDLFLSFKSKILILHKIYSAVHFLHQLDIFHTYINMESIFILKNSILYLGCLEKAYTLMIDSYQYKYQNHRIYTPIELRSLLNEQEERRDMILPCRKTDIYQLGILSLQFLFSIHDNQLGNNQEIEKQILAKIPKKFSIIELLLQCIDDNMQNRPSINQLLTELENWNISQIGN